MTYFALCSSTPENILCIQYDDKNIIKDKSRAKQGWIRWTKEKCKLKTIPSMANRAGEKPKAEGEDCKFVWDDDTQLFFHASSGFYHDPNAGWYYSSRDGLYYKFDNGTYIPLDMAPICKVADASDSNGGSATDLKNYEVNDNFYHFEPPLGASKQDPISRNRAALAVENSSFLAEKDGYPLWYYDHKSSLYWYYDEKSKAYYMYDPTLTGFGRLADENHASGTGDIYVSSNSIHSNNTQSKDIDEAKWHCGNTSEKQSATEGCTYQANVSDIEPINYTVGSLENKSTEDREIDPDNVNSSGEFLAVEDNPQRPSEWIEETLINLYLKGYSNFEHVVEEPCGASMDVDENSNKSPNMLNSGILASRQSCVRDDPGLIYERDSGSFLEDYTEPDVVGYHSGRTQEEEIEEGECFPEDSLDRLPLSEKKGIGEGDYPYPYSSFEPEGYDASRDECLEDIESYNLKHQNLADVDSDQRDEDNWRAQYGQVVRYEEEDIQAFSTIDLWDWTMVLENLKGREGELARLVGRVGPRSNRMHPSIQGGSALLKTAAICEVQLDLVRVSSGQIYRLRRPSARYMASLSMYDSSNPTQDWGFPPLYVTKDEKLSDSFVGDSEATNTSNIFDISTLSKPFVPNFNHQQFQHCRSKKTQRGNSACFVLKAYTIKEIKDAELRRQRYRDRAAERRILQGGIGVGPGQKKANKNDFEEQEICSTTEIVESSGADPTDSAFVVGSIGRRLLEGMGWKEGESLGNRKGGLISPLQAVGNKGHAGLGWP